MAFVVVLFRDEEVTRRELDGPVVIGRAPECDISVRDILLSRRHCRVTPADGGGWAVEDLGSKNGTRVAGEPVQYSVLRDGTSVRIGKTQVKFYSGSMNGAARPPRPAAPPRRRPVDPFEALSGTVAEFEFQSDQPARDLSRLPTPRPKPADPESYSKEDVYSMLTEIASSSWDSIYATASGPAAVVVAGQSTRPLAVSGVKSAGLDLPPRRRNVVTDASLQVDHAEPAASAVPAPVDPPAPRRADEQTPLAEVPPRRQWLAPVGSVLRKMQHVLSGRFLRRAG